MQKNRKTKEQGVMGLVNPTPGPVEYTADMCLCWVQIDSTHCSRERDASEPAYNSTEKNSLYDMIWALIQYKKVIVRV